MATNDERRGILIVFVTILSRIMGLLRTLFISNIYGAGEVADLINYSYSLPNQARKGLQEGLGNVDLLSRLHNDRAYAEKCVRSILGLHFYVGIILLAISFPVGYVLLHFSSYSLELRSIGMSFFPFYLLSLLFYSISQSFNAVLQDQGHYSRGQVHPLVYSVIVLSGIAIFGRSHIYAFPISLLIGSVVYFVISVISLRRLGIRIGIDFRIERNLRNSYIKGNYMVILYMMMNMVYYISSSQSASGATCFTLAHTLVLIPYSIVLMLFTGLYYPRIATNGRRGMRLLILDRALEMLLVLILPITLLIFTFSREISVFLFEGGAFTMENALMVSKLVDIMLPGIIFMLLFAVLERIAFLERSEGRVYVTLISTTSAILLILLVAGEGRLEVPAILFTVSNVLSALILLFTTMAVNGRRVMHSILDAVLIALPVIFLTVIWRLSGIFLFDIFSSKLAVLIVALIIGGVASAGSFLIYYMMKLRKG